jgi:hypothetical protein
MTALWARIEIALGQVQKPARYIGCEDGAVTPRYGPGTVSWLLAYPDAYEVGLPNQGLQILYEISERTRRRRRRADLRAGIDLARCSDSTVLPLFSVDTHPRGLASSTCWRSTCRRSWCSRTSSR